MSHDGPRRRGTPARTATLALMAQHRPEVDRWILDAIGTDAGTVLDLGCGVGRNAFLLWERGSGTRCAGMDVDEDYIGRARRLGIYERLELADLTTPIPAEDGSFEVVLCTDVLGYLARDAAERLLVECERVASRGPDRRRDARPPDARPSERAGPLRLDLPRSATPRLRCPGLRLPPLSGESRRPQVPLRLLRRHAAAAPSG